MMKYSIIVPVYNRPEETKELLESLTTQYFNDFEVLIVEDGSQIDSENIVNEFVNSLDIKYYSKENSGPGLSRNYGYERAEGAFLIVLDSDVILPAHYLTEVDKSLNDDFADAFGGPDRAHPSFTNLQKSINYAMTSFFTTGGIRGGKAKLDKFYPRSFNMGISKKVFEHTNGFGKMRFGEDVDFSMRIVEAGFKTKLIPGAYVYHKRRTDFKKFFKQVANSGLARINLSLLHKGSLKIVHLLPMVFTLGCLFLVFLSVLTFKSFFLFPLFIYATMIFVDSLLKNKSLAVAILSIPASFIQLIAYGYGFILGIVNILLLKNKDFKLFQKNFYK